MITVFGATGNVGREVVSLLTAAGGPVRAVTRDPSRAGFGAGIEVVRGDPGRPGDARRALAGADAAFVVTAGPDAPAHALAIAQAVRRCGTGRVVTVSSVAAMEPVTNAYGAAHAEAERAFRDCGAAWTLLRPAAFMSNTLQWLWSLGSEGRVYQPYGELPQAVVDPADVAEVAVRALTGPGHEGRVHTLTGPQALTGRDRARLLATALGRPVEFVDAPPRAAKEAMVAAGLPAGYAEALLAAQGDPDPARGGVPLPTVAEVTGRPPRTFADWLARHLHRFA
uniref:Uncharacterized protein llpL n=1 Tax=Streptomyces tendae TaxID=1932 RepID=A7DWJ9_STRTE|nr:hypothetical protein [Streptomyces tendae]